MPDVEFLSKATDRHLPWDATNDCFVYRQFGKGWYARFLRQESLPPRIKIGDDWLSLVPCPGSGGYEVPDHAMRALIKIQSGDAVDASLESYAGHLRLWSGTDPPMPLSPEIWVEAGSLEQNEFDEIVRRLQQLAAFHYSPFQGKVRGDASGTFQHEKPNHSDDPDRLLLQAAKQLRDLGQCVCRNWPLIRATAAKETRLIARSVDAFRYHGPNSSRLIQMAASRPAARRLEVQIPQESHRTTENFFLAYVLAEILRKSEPVSGRLMDRANQLSDEWSSGNQPNTLKYGRGGRYGRFDSSWNTGREEITALVGEMRKIAGEIASVARKIIPLRGEPFLKECLSEPTFPERPSDKLTQSKAYGPVFRAYHHYRREAGRFFLPLNSGLEKALASESVYPAWNLYELWVLVELFDMLVTQFGFQPEGPEYHPLQHVEIVGGEVIRHRLAGREFRLRHKSADDRGLEITIRLWYDTQHSVSPCQSGKRCFRAGVCQTLPCYAKIMNRRHWRYLQPDLLMEVAVTGDGPGRAKRFAVDAKYRRYAKQNHVSPEDRVQYGVDTVFELDLLGTAKMKYRDGLGCEAAFILHSDPNPDYVYWGGKPWDKTPLGEREPFFPGHHYGAVFATPRDVSGMEMLINCVLMYHMRIEDICWHCCKTVSPVKDILPLASWTSASSSAPRRSVGNCYQCPDCHRFWVRTWCQKGHYLVKMGRQTFHSPKPATNGLYICPECGDQTRLGNQEGYELRRYQEVEQEEYLGLDSDSLADLDRYRPD